MVTLIIPTLDRQDLLLRAIDYYQYFDCKVLIADSSDNKFVHKFPDNIIYKHLPKACWTEKLYEAAKDIVTPYVCLVPDDDYLLESSLKEGTFFLGNNLEYASVQGRYYKFELIENQVVFSPRYDLKSNSYAIESEDRYSRLAKTFNPYFPQIYSVHRTNLFVKGCKFASVFKGYDFESFPITELLTPLVPMCYGKHKVLPILWMVRDYYIFDRIRRQNYIPYGVESNKFGLIAQHYKQLTYIAKIAKKFLKSEECQQLEKSFRDVISDVASNKESDMLFEVAFKSYSKWLISERNKITLKLIIKLFIPNSFFQRHKKYNNNKYASGIEDTTFKNDFKKIRLSVMKFKKCYDA
jgi:glycosyltransferase domain-containing protein